jgi:hypothetical protein
MLLQGVRVLLVTTGCAHGRFSGCTAKMKDGTDDLVAQLDHHAAAKEYDVRQLGQRRDRDRELNSRRTLVL